MWSQPQLIGGTSKVSRRQESPDTMTARKICVFTYLWGLAMEKDTPSLAWLCST
jgi:hypothetical protein